MVSFLVVGGSNIDVKGKSKESLILGHSNPGKVYVIPGGVGRNITSTLANLGALVYFITSFSDDPWGMLVRVSIDKTDVNAFVIDKNCTGVYIAVLDDKGKTVVGVAGPNPVSDLKWEEIERFIPDEPKVWIFDTNISYELARNLVDEANRRDVKTVMVPASPRKMAPFVNLVESLDIVIVNEYEADIIGDVRPKDLMIVTRRSKVTLYSKGEAKDIEFSPLKKYVDDTGAGDTFAAAFVYNYFANGVDIYDSVRMALDYAKASMQHYSSDI